MPGDTTRYLLIGLILASCAILPCAADTTLTLNEGWNYIAIPFTHTNYQHSAFSLFSTVDTMGHSIMRYNGTTRQWEVLNQQTLVAPLEGIWVYSAQATQIPVAGDNTEHPVPRHLQEGWNAVGFAGSAASPGEAFSSLSDHWLIVMGWDAIKQQYSPTIFNGDPAGSQVVEPGKGYWIYLNTPGEYTIVQPLQPAPPSGNLTVSSYPEGSLVYIDGVNTGVTTVALFNSIPQGVHTIRLTSNGYPDYSTTVTVNANQTTSLYASLLFPD